MNMKKEIIVTKYDSTQLIDCIRNAIKALNIDKNNVNLRDTKNLEDYVNSVYRDAPMYRFIINAYKGDLKIPNTKFINKAFRYELDGCIVGGGCSYSSATDTTAQYKEISWYLDGQKTIN
jgi:hypothetical protein